MHARLLLVQVIRLAGAGIPVGVGHARHRSAGRHSPHELRLGARVNALTGRPEVLSEVRKKARTKRRI